MFCCGESNDDKEKLFLYCTWNYGFWEWIVKDESRGECSRGSTTFPNIMMDNTDEEMSRMFQSRVWISDE